MFGIKNIGLVVAVDSKLGIGKQNALPWSVKEDMDYFQKITTRKGPTEMNAVLMGKNTWQSIPDKFRGLKDRYNIIVSKTMTKDDLLKENCTRAESYITPSLNEGIKLCTQLKNLKDVFIIGGSMLYKEAIDKEIVNKMYINKLEHDFGCDRFFPFDFEKLKKGRIFTEKNTNLGNVIDKISGKTISLTNTILEFNDNNIDEKNYLDLLQKILNDGELRKTRNAMTRSIFGPQMVFELTNTFPLITTKRVFFRGIVEELLWFLRGDTNSNHLSDKGVKIWEPNTTRNFLDSRSLPYKVGDIGPMYGFNWRHFGANYSGMENDYRGKGFDQLKNVIELLMNDKTSRRIMMTTYDPSKVPESVLAPCHGIITQFYVREGEFLDCKTYIRSSDAPVGLPYNIASYSLLVHIICEVVNLKPGKLYISFGDTHIYECHREAVETQLKREPYKFPELRIVKKYNKVENEDTLNSALDYINNLKYEDIELLNYKFHPGIKMDMVA